MIEEIEEITERINQVQQKAFVLKANLEVQEKSRANLEKKCIELGYNPDNLEEVIKELEEEESIVTEKINLLIEQLESIIAKHDNEENN